MVGERLSWLLIVGISACAADSLTHDDPESTLDRAPIGVLGSSTIDTATGWACDVDTPHATVETHLYVGGSAGNCSSPCTGIPQVMADRPSETAVTTACGGGSAHRFSHRFATNTATKLGPGVHELNAYALNTAAGGAPSRLAESPKFVTVPATNLHVEYPPNTESLVFDMDTSGGLYAYAPTIMVYNGHYHMWACSHSSGVIGDVVSYKSSTDGVHWSAREIVLTVDGSISDTFIHACDPSVVRFAPPGTNRKFYYMFFSAYQPGIGTVNAVARSDRPNGPFRVFVGGDATIPANWHATPVRSIPHLTQVPREPVELYGAGQPSVVVTEDYLRMWYYDDSVRDDAAIMYAISYDGVTWSAATKTNLSSSISIDVKYDPSLEAFVMADLKYNHYVRPRLLFRVSSDGVHWETLEMTNSRSIPAYSHNPGITGTESGHLVGAPYAMIAFGAPYDLRPDYDNDCAVSGPGACWAYWDVFAARLRFRWR